MAVPIYSDDACLAHSAGSAHPERPERISAILRRLRGRRADSGIGFMTARPASIDSLVAVHDRVYLSALEATETAPFTVFDADTTANQHTWRAARAAAGAAVAAVDQAVADPTARPFVVARPPGHHAEADRAMGFCFVNTAAVAAAHAHAVGIERVAIVDWDVHHGNGTERIFADRADVLYVSLHQYPHYPGTGARTDRGSGAGLGYTVNVPLPAGSGEREYRDAFAELLPVLTDYAPQILIVSAGFDADSRDPLASMEIGPAAYRWMTERLADCAIASAGGRIVHVLEGGYDLSALADGVDAVVGALLEYRT